VLFVLFTCLKFVVRFLEATWVRAEILLALCASHTKFTHAFSSFSSNWFIVPILLVHIYLSWLDTHYVSTVASYEVRIFFHKISQDNLVVFLSLIAEENTPSHLCEINSLIHVEFLLRDHSLAILLRTSNVQASLCKLK
jgi:hypothetical protein